MILHRIKTRYLLVSLKGFVLFLIFLFSDLQAKHYETLFKLHLENPRSSIRGIDGVYVINLDIRPERWHRVEPILYYYGIAHTRFSAVFGWDFEREIVNQFCARHLRMGALGIMLSHLSIYHDALERGLKIIWVLEDDVEILRDPKVLTSLINEIDRLDPEWDVLYTDLDFINKDGSFTRNIALPEDKENTRVFPHSLEYYTYRENLSENIQLIRSRYDTTSMIMSERGMKKILDYFTTHDITWPYDIELHFVTGIRQYGIINPVATNAHFPYNFSDTGLGIKKYYEISDENVESIQRRLSLYEEMLNRWYEIFKECP